MTTGAIDRTRLVAAFDRFYKILDASTRPTESGARVVGGVAHAVALSEATCELYIALSETQIRMIRESGEQGGNSPVRIELLASDSPNGPWKKIPNDALRITNAKIGGTGVDAVLLAAIESASSVVAFPIDRWNALQASRPGADHQRFRVGETISKADLDSLESAQKLFCLSDSPAQPSASGSPDLPAGADALEQNDVALLAFLNRSPSLRRKVSDVLPDEGPQDRKAIAKRLRRLADRTPALVDYPKDGRSGVAILPAGAEALKRATAPTPH